VQPPTTAADTVRLVLLGTTDIHGQLLPWDYHKEEELEGGLARVATLVDSIRRAEPNVILLDSGDLLQGNPLDYYYGVVRPAEMHPVIRAMSRLGYDAAVLGNHEFNYGLPALDRALEEAEFPFLAGNVFVAGTDSLRWPAWTLVERSGVRIAILGLTTPGSAIWDDDNLTGKLDFRDIVASAESAWPQVEAASDLQVAILHSGIGPGSSYDEEGTGVPEENAGQRLAETLPGLDAVFLGHSHRQIDGERVNGVTLTQAGKWGEALAVAEITLVGEPGSWRVADLRTDALSTEDVPPEPGFVEEIRPWHERVLAYVADTIGWTPDDWSATRARLEDTPILDLIQRVQMDASGAELSAAAAFVTDAGLGAGPITRADLASVYVYDNTLKAIEVTGRQLRDYLEYSARYFHRVDPEGRAVDAAGDDDLAVDSVPGYNFDVVAGVDYAIDLTEPVGSRVEDLTYRGAPVDDDRRFKLAINNYRQAGGGGFSMIAGAPVVYDRGEEIRQLLIDWIAARDTIREADVFEPSWRILPAAAVERAAPGGRAEAGAGGTLDSLLATLPPPFPAASDSLRLAVLATNDFHGALEPLTPPWAQGDTIGGAATLASYVAAVRSRYPGATLYLDGGDVMQGTLISNLTHGRSTVDVLGRIGPDAAAVGNHEFDWGVDTLRARMAEAPFAWLSANIFEKATGERPAWTPPYAWLETAGLRVAVIGATTLSTPETTLPANVEPYEFRDIADVVNELAPRLKAEGADLIVLVVHAGAIATRDEGYVGEIVDAARRITAPLDLIVSGHTHSEVRAEVNGIPIVQARSSGTALGVVTLTFDRRDDAVVGHSIDVWTTRHDEVAPDPDIAAQVETYAANVESLAGREIARLARPLRRDRDDESALGDLIADAQRAATGDQIALVNGGGIRTDLDAGPVSYADAFAVQPFQNTLISLELNGEQLRRALEAVVEDRLGEVSGIRYRFDPTRARGRRVLDAWLEESGEAVVRDGAAVHPDATYSVTANNFMASGGSGYDVLAEAEGTSTGLVDSEVLVEYLAGLPQPIEYEKRGRVERLAAWPEERR
jgi:2',3'-cyclic-nucleotide 2'-phosphodiesterase/3'-nucleotidase/5'-nucleotidase